MRLVGAVEDDGNRPVAVVRFHANGDDSALLPGFAYQILDARFAALEVVKFSSFGEENEAFEIAEAVVDDVTTPHSFLFADNPGTLSPCDLGTRRLAATTGKACAHPLGRTMPISVGLVRHMAL